jgi:hypothetical protein
MRRKLLGTIAAVAAGTGAAWGQTPPPPVPVGPAGPAAVGIAPGPMPGGMPPGAVDPSAMFPGGPMPGMTGPGGPMIGGPGGYGLHGEPQWQPPFTKKGDVTNYSSRIAPLWWFDAEYLMMFASSMPARYPFVTTSAPAAGGQLGATSTTILHSTTDLGFGLLHGFRLTGGYFRDDERRFGWYASGFMTGQKSNDFLAVSDQTGQPLLARPFVNAATGLNDVLLVSFPTFAAGGVEVRATNQVWGAEGGPIINLFRSCPDDCGVNGGCLWNINLLTGFRFLQIHETLDVQQFTRTVGNSTLIFDGKIYGAPAQVEVHDQIDVYNQFYGGNVGLSNEVRWGRCAINLTGKVALGVMHQRVDINGFSILSTTDPTGAPVTSVARGGLYANSSNIGRYKHDEFCVVPEVAANFQYAWCSWLSTSVGYTFLYASRVARPTEQFSTTVSPATIPTSPSYGLGSPIAVPSPLFNQSDFWLQGVTFGVHIRY